MRRCRVPAITRTVTNLLQERSLMHDLKLMALDEEDLSAGDSYRVQTSDTLLHAENATRRSSAGSGLTERG